MLAHKNPMIKVGITTDLYKDYWNKPKTKSPSDNYVNAVLNKQPLCKRESALSD